jgi:DNA-binding HxlR family transcriptional regulator
MNKKRKRDVPQLFFISKDEERLILEKMEEAGIKNKSAYLRKMALDGYIIKQDFTSVKEAVYELNKIGVNLNQMTKTANTYGDVYLSELKSIREGIEKIWQQLLSKVYQ